MNAFKMLFLGISAVLLMACNNDKTGIKTADLKGKWVCTDALVNGEKNDLMIKDEATQNPGAVIEMTESVLRFDLLSELKKKKEHNYKIEGDKLKSAVDPELVFTVKKLEGDKMIIAFSADEMNFELTMQKQ